jgi:anti-sigma factor RsiW
MNMMCPIQGRENVEILLDYCARTLPADTLARLDQHVAECPSCRRELAAQQQVWSALDEFDATELNISADFDRRLYARIEAEHQEPFWVRGWRKVFASGQPGAWRPAFSMAAVVMAAVVLLLVQLPKSPVADDVTPVTQEQAAPVVNTAIIDSQDVEGLDSALEDIEMLHLLGSTGPANSNAL